MGVGVGGGGGFRRHAHVLSCRWPQPGVHCPLPPTGLPTCADHTHPCAAGVFWENVSTPYTGKPALGPFGHVAACCCILLLPCAMTPHEGAGVAALVPHVFSTHSAAVAVFNHATPRPTPPITLSVLCLHGPGPGLCSCNSKVLLHICPLPPSRRDCCVLGRLPAGRAGEWAGGRAVGRAGWVGG